MRWSELELGYSTRANKSTVRWILIVSQIRLCNALVSCKQYGCLGVFVTHCMKLTKSRMLMGCSRSQTQFKIFVHALSTVNARFHKWQTCCLIKEDAQRVVVM